MGGHPEGEVASQLALQTLAALFQREAKPTLADPLRFLHDAMIAGHHQLLRYATERALIDTPRTTVVACVLQGNAAYWAHCGDSRLYLVRGDKLIARTRDHSYTELQETLSQVVPMGERFNRNVLFTCLGSPGKPVVDTAGPLLMQPGDRVLLCSDGLWGASATPSSASSWRASRSPTPCPSWSRWRCAAPGRRATTSPCCAWSGRRPRTAIAAAGVSTQNLGDEVFASTIQASLLGDAAARRTRRRRDRALDPRDQRSHPALVATQELTPEAPAALPQGAPPVARRSRFHGVARWTACAFRSLPRTR